MIGENDVIAMDWVAKSKRVVGSSASMIWLRICCMHRCSLLGREKVGREGKPVRLENGRKKFGIKFKKDKTV